MRNLNHKSRLSRQSPGFINGNAHLENVRLIPWSGRFKLYSRRGRRRIRPAAVEHRHRTHARAVCGGSDLGRLRARAPKCGAEQARSFHRG